VKYSRRFPRSATASRFSVTSTMERFYLTTLFGLAPVFLVQNTDTRPRLSPSATIRNRRRKTTLANLSGIVKQLTKERDRLHRQLSGLNAALEAFAGDYRGNNGIKPRRKISAKGRASIAAAQKARWARVKGLQAGPKKRTMSASARRKIAAAQKKRWAKLKRQKRNTGNDRATRL
jgi:hypothetical protein